MIESKKQEYELSGEVIGGRHVMVMRVYYEDTDFPGSCITRATHASWGAGAPTISRGFLQRTPRGRLLTGHAFRHLGLAEPARDPGQFQLFAGDESDE